MSVRAHVCSVRLWVRVSVNTFIADRHYTLKTLINELKETLISYSVYTTQHSIFLPVLEYEHKIKNDCKSYNYFMSNQIFLRSVYNYNFHGLKNLYLVNINKDLFVHRFL